VSSLPKTLEFLVHFCVSVYERTPYEKWSVLKLNGSNRRVFGWMQDPDLDPNLDLDLDLDLDLGES
jgi:hypothetical protein